MKIRILVAYSMTSTNTQTTLDYLNSFKDYLDADVDYLHVTNDPKIKISLSRYDVVIQSYCARLYFEGYVSEDFIGKLTEFKGLKVLAVQDEYNRTDILKRAIKKIQYDVVLTCVPQDSIDYVYPRDEFKNVHFETIFTGYVPDHLAESEKSVRPIRDRPIAIGYRGRDIGAFYGRLGFDKYEIGRRMKEVCELRGISHDIAMDEESRIYGPAWFDFLGSCRSMLGSESGSNVFDFDGALEQRFNEMTARLGRRPSYSEFEPFVAQRDSEISMGQISPRIFECALMRTPMVLFKGRYSDAIEPNVHYIALEKDFSNVDNVLAQLQRFDDLEAMVGRTYDHLVASGRFGYRAFIGRLRGIIDQQIGRRSTTPSDKSDEKVEMLVDSVMPHWQLMTPTKKPIPASEFYLIDKKNLFVIYRDEILKLEQLEAGALRIFRETCDILNMVLSTSTDRSGVAAFRRLVDDAEIQFRTLYAERSAISQQVSRFSDITNISEMDRLLEVYERQTKVLQGIYDSFEKTYNQLVLNRGAFISIKIRLIRKVKNVVRRVRNIIPYFEAENRATR